MKLQERYFDNIVISTQPVGPVENSSTIHGIRNQRVETPVKVTFMKNRLLTFNSDRAISRLSLFAALGKIIFDGSVSNSRTVAFDCSSLAGGVYLYRVDFADKASVPCWGKVFVFQ